MKDNPESSTDGLQRLYDEAYYKHGCGPLPYERTEHWTNVFALIADELIRSLHPRRVLDAGCAMGFLVEAFWDRGVECHGIDLSTYAISQVRRDMQAYCRVASITTPIEGRYDLITCIEVLEHLPPEQAEPAIGTLCSATDTILFSSTPSDFQEPTHLNVRPTIYWLQLFAKFDFFPLVSYDAGFVSPHAMVLRRGARASESDVLVLFSELLRYKQAHLDKVNLINTITAKNSGSQPQEEQIQDLERQLRQTVAIAEASRRDLLSQLTEARSAAERTTDSERNVTELEHEIKSLTTRVTELREENARLQQLNATLFQQRNELHHDLQGIVQSAGWKLIDRYRKWLWHQQKVRPGFFIKYERFAQWVLRSHDASASGVQASLPPAGAQQSKQLTDSSQKETDRPKLFSTAGDPGYQRWIIENEPDCQELRQQREESSAWSHRPLFSIIIPVYRVATAILAECIQSVRDQSYDHWELCICNAWPEDQNNQDLLSALAGNDPRIRVTVLESNRGISGNSNRAAEMARGEYLVFLDHDDALAPSALYEAAKLLSSKPDTDLIYSDHDYIDESGSVRYQPLFKPNWSPEVMLSAAYITHLTILRKALLVSLGGFDSSTDGAQDWDLFLRASEKTQKIEHIPQVLYHWRVHGESTALNSSAKEYANDAQLLALSRHMERIGLPASPERMPDGLLHVRWKRQSQPLVSIVIPTRDKVQLLSKCVSSILERTAYASYEILIIDTGSQETETREYYATLAGKPQIRLLDYGGKFNYSAVNNIGARAAKGDLLLFLNNDTEVTDPNWLTELAGWALYDPIGIVGAKLLRPDGTIQHAGVTVGLGGFADHPFADMAPLTYGMFGSTGWYRNYLAVTGACMMMRRDVFEKIGGFDESFVLCGSDVEICLRVWEHGYRVVYNPFAELIHHERQTRKTNIPPEDFNTSYRHYEKYLTHGDPYWNPNLSVWNRQIGFRSKDEPSSLQFVHSYLHKVDVSGAPVPGIEVAPPEIAHNSPPSEAELLVGWFDFSEEEARNWQHQAASVSGPRRVETIAWFIPPFVNAFYGGIFTILRFASYWQKTKGVRNVFAICGAVDSTLMLQRINEVLPGCKKSDVYILPSINDVRDLPPTDASIATLWTTAYFALRYRKTTRKYYFIQDYEPAFFSAGSASALVESTYRLGFYGITNTSSLRRFYEEEFGGKAIHFTPCVDQEVFYPQHGKPALAEDRPWQVFCYARPSHGRNAFELIAAALRRLKSRLGGKVRIVTAGEDWRAADHDLEGIVENLGILPYEETARLYRETDIGVVLMLTRHPSYIPMELMASGCLVVTNRNHWTEWLLKDGENCLLSYATSTGLADTIERGLKDATLRKEIVARALALVRERYRDWTPEMERVYGFLCDPEPEPAGGQATHAGTTSVP